MTATGTGIGETRQHALGLDAAFSLASESPARSHFVAEDLRECAGILATEAAILQGVGANGSAAAVGDVSARLERLASGLTREFVRVESREAKEADR